MRFALVLASFSFLLSSAAFAEDITETDLRAHIEILASDDFGGRKPGTLGENKTVNYIATQWAEAGLVSAAKDDGWYAPVILVERTPLSQTVSFRTRDTEKPLKLKQSQIVLRGSEEHSSITNARPVYVGYTSATDFPKADFDGAAVFIDMDAPEDRDDLEDYRTRKKSYLDANVSVIITIIDGKSRWRTMKRRFRQSSTTLSGKKNHAPIEAIITRKEFEKLVRRSKSKKNDLSTNKQEDEFQPRTLNIYANMISKNNVRKYQSHNVVGKIPGSKPEAGALLFLGHWDHFGTCRRPDAADPEKDLICNGAVDNASGISLLIEVAKRLKNTKPDRDIYFLATTAEESGLLGAKAFVEDPVFDLDSLVAVFNADTVALAPDGKTIAIVGRGETPLDIDLEKIAEAEGRKIDTSDKANAFLRRQDGFVFLEKDIPALMVTSAFADQELLDAYLNNQYHDVTDELNDKLPLGGAADDANFHVALGRYFSSTETYPAKASGDKAVN